MPAQHAGRGLGWKRQPVEPPGLASARHLVRATPSKREATCRSQIVSILDQGQLGSCVANATAQACRASMVRQGAVEPPLGSRLWLYWLARAYDHDTNHDDGTYGHNAFMALVEHGLPPEYFWPYSDDSSPGALFTKMPGWSAMQAAFDQSAVSQPRYFRIFETGVARVEAVRQAISQGHCVVFGTSVSEQFCSQDPGGQIIQPPVSLPIAGGHELLLAEYDQASFGVVNSWSGSWGQAGWCRFSPEYIEWDQSSDFWICDTTPTFSQGAA
jgi:C1A family cysteine protease